MATQTHYLPFFAEPRGRYGLAVCGKVIRAAEHDVEPDCPKCVAWLKADDAEAKALGAKWDAEEAEKLAQQTGGTR